MMMMEMWISSTLKDAENTVRTAIVEKINRKSGSGEIWFNYEKFRLMFRRRGKVSERFPEIFLALASRF